MARHPDTGEFVWEGFLSDALLAQDPSEPRPKWVRSGPLVETLCDLSEWDGDRFLRDGWPDFVRFAFRPWRDDMDRGDVEWLVEEMLRQWAPLDAWEVGPDQEAAPPDMILRRIEWGDVDGGVVEKLDRSVRIRRSRWIGSGSSDSRVL